ncbi:MAG: serine/threonine-protein kinase, partial [Myxococcota bacterium]
ARGAPPAAAPEQTPAAAPESLPAGPGRRYRIARELGRGGMGVVHLAEDTVLEREVALKELPRSLVREPSLAERFRIEARVLAKLTHPGIVQVFDLVESDAGMWIAMELVKGGSLDALLDDGPVPLRDALRLGAEMADALAHAHAQGVVHRDFKPHNVLLTPQGHPKITDFGLAKIAREGPKLTQVGAIMGSPAYMSPEQAAGGETDHRADVYAFGVTLYQMVVGRCPFEGNTASILAAHITQPAPDPAELGADVPAPLRELLVSMLAKDPADRPADLALVADRLRRIAADAAAP